LELENERASANVGAFFLYIYYMITRKKKKCKECGNDSYIWSKGRCKKCASRSYKGIGPSKNVKEKIDLDTKFYEEIWSERPHYCEECDKVLETSGSGICSHTSYQRVLNRNYAT
jgi:ribosomal protein L37E